MITDDDVKKLKQIFATKDDLKRFATKKDLKRFATKIDLEDGMRHLENKIEKSNEKWHSRIFDLVDGLAKGVVTNREFRALTTYKIGDLDKRVKILEG